MDLNILGNLGVVIWLVWVFGVGAAVGSFLNVLILRLPMEKSPLWPSSRCWTCLQPIRGRDNIPILGYFLVGRKCRACKTPFSGRYVLIEILTAVIFTALFYFEIIRNCHDIPFLAAQEDRIRLGYVPLEAWLFWLHHAIFVSCLLVASICDLDGKVIPLSVTVCGTITGLIGATLFPWPWPSSETILNDIPPHWAWTVPALEGEIPQGMYPWPLWRPRELGLAPGSWQLGLLTGLCGAAVGTFMMRLVKFLFEKTLGKEALGLGDADLMMMVGAFLGWQIVVASFFIGAFLTLFVAIPMMVMGKQNLFPFGPGLALGAVTTWFAWGKIGPMVQFPFNDSFMIGFSVVFMALGMLIAGVVLSVVRGRPQEPTS